MAEYISRDEALNFETEIDADPDEIQAISRGMALYAEHIKAIPAADVVPVVHARWIHVGCGLFDCDNCGKRIMTNVYKEEDVRESWKYCLNCGAKMDLEGEETRHD